MCPTRRRRDWLSRSTRLGLQVDVSAFWRGAIACTGTEFCKLAIAETKGFSKWLVSEMEERLPGFDQQIKLHVTGCTNSCGQHWIADIGLEGKKIKKDGKMVDAFYFCVGGAVGKFAGTARPTGLPGCGCGGSGCDRAAAARVSWRAPAGRGSARLFRTHG